MARTLDNQASANGYGNALLLPIEVLPRLRSARYHRSMDDARRHVHAILVVGNALG